MLVPYLALLALAVPSPASPAASRAPARRVTGVSAGPPRRLQLRKRRLDRWYYRHTLHAEVEFPEVTGLSDPALQARINRTIRSAFPAPHGYDAWLRSRHPTGASEPGWTEELEGHYEITLNRSGLLSVQFYGFDDSLQNGLLGGAHPNPVSGAVTLDTRTGRAYKLSDLFTGPGWRERLDQQIVRAAVRQPGMSDAADYIQVLREYVKSHEYWYYLRPHSISFYDLDSSYAGHAVGAEIPLEQLRPLMNPKGPLPALLGAAPRGVAARPVGSPSRLHEGAR